MFRTLYKHSVTHPAKLSLAALLATSIFYVPSAHAQSSTPIPATSKFGIGLGVAVVDKAYRDFDQETVALPILSYENEWISASLPTFDVKAFKAGDVSFRLRARYAGDGYEAEDSPILTGMSERKSSLWLGGAVIWNAGFANISGELLTDAMGNSKGNRAKLQIDRRFASGKFGLTPRLGAEWVDKKYVDYYYGVQLSEATTGRAFYEGKSTANLQAGIRLDYSINPKNIVFLDISTTSFGSAVKDSPLVDKSSQSVVAVGYSYRF